MASLYTSRCLYLFLDQLPYWQLINVLRFLHFPVFLHYKSTTSTCQITGGSLHHNCTKRKVESLYLEGKSNGWEAKTHISSFSGYFSFTIHNTRLIISPANSVKDGIALLEQSWTTYLFLYLWSYVILHLRGYMYVVARGV